MTDLIGDLISQSTFDERELEREKNVIEQEIAESLEDPQEMVFNLLFKVLFNDHPIAYPITGKTEIIRSITRDQLIDYYHNHFLKSKVCISAAGKIDHNALVKKLAQNSHLSLTVNPKPINQPPVVSKQTFLIQNRSNLTQIHVAGASATIPYTDPRRYGLTILNNIMNWRYFDRLREDEGLVYTISTFTDLYSDIGLIGEYFITEVDNYYAAVKAGLELAMKLKSDDITDDEFKRAVNFSKGMLAIGAENPMSRMIRNAKNQLLLGHVISVDEAIANFDQYTKNEVNRMTEEIRPDQHSTAIIGNAKKVEEIMQRLSRPGKIIIQT